MHRAVGVVQFQPAPDFDRLLAVMHEDPREVIPQAKHFLDHGQPDRVSQARTYSLLCYTSACVLQRSEAESVFHGHEAVRLSRELTGHEGQQILFDSLINLGLAAERIGEYSRSIEAFREALGMPLDWLGRRVQEEATLTYLARVHYCRGDYEDALTALDQAGALGADRQDPYVNEQLHSMRGMCYLKMDELDLAEQYLTAAAAVTNEETRYEIRPKAQLLSKMGILRLLQGEMEQAEIHAQAALEIATAVEDLPGQVEGRLVLACTARARHRVRQAIELSALAARTAFELGYVPLLQEMSWLLGHLYPLENE